jgi:ABC-type polysaccharide/polyol phosphate export permease
MVLLTAVVAKDTGAAGGGVAAIYIVLMMMYGANLAVLNETTRKVASFMPQYCITDSLSAILHTGQISNPVIYKNFIILVAITIVVVVVGIQLFSKTAFRTD